MTDVVCDDRVCKEDLAEKMGTADESERDLAVIRALQSSGFLIDCVGPNGNTTGSYQLWSPRLATYATSVAEGRKELLKLFQRQKYKEIKATRIFTLQLKKSRLIMKYHIRDLMGLGLVKELQTPGGKFYRLSSS